MNINELNQIIKYIRKTFPCGKCHKEYNLNEIEVISTFEDQGLFHLNCHKCQINLIVHVTVSDEPTSIAKEPLSIKLERKHRSIKHHPKEKKTTTAIISSNEVLDMINYFNNFNGDFKKLFSVKK